MLTEEAKLEVERKAFKKALEDLKVYHINDYRASANQITNHYTTDYFQPEIKDADVRDHLEKLVKLMMRYTFLVDFAHPYS